MLCTRRHFLGCTRFYSFDANWRGGGRNPGRDKDGMGRLAVLSPIGFPLCYASLLLLLPFYDMFGNIIDVSSVLPVTTMLPPVSALHNTKSKI